MAVATARNDDHERRNVQARIIPTVPRDYRAALVTEEMVFRVFLIMYPSVDTYIVCGENTPQQDDVNGINALYP
jgi:hypothetical protein